MAEFDAILFDFDGVLADSEPVHFSCWSEILQPLGIQIDWLQYQKHCIGLHDGDVIEYLAGLAEPTLPAGCLWDRYERKKEMFVARMNQAPPFAPDLVELLKSLRSYRLAVVTSSEQEEVEPVLEAGGIRGFFKILVCADDVAQRKPSPEPYLLAAKRLNAQTPLVVEDSDAGVASGAAAGFEVLKVPEAGQTAELVRGRLRGLVNFR